MDPNADNLYGAFYGYSGPNDPAWATEPTSGTLSTPPTNSGDSWFNSLLRTAGTLGAVALGQKPAAKPMAINWSFVGIAAGAVVVLLLLVSVIHGKK